MKMKMFKIVSTALCAVALCHLSAKAASYTLTTPNSDISAYGAPFGTVNVMLNSANSATITFTAGSSGAYHYLFGDGGSVALNVNGGVSSFSIGSYLQPQSPTQTPSFSQASGNEDGFGNFNFQLDNVDGYQHAVSVLTFTITTSGTWGSDTAVLFANGNNAAVGAHIFVVNSDYSNTTFTGYAAGGNGSGGPQVPDGGSTVALLGWALAAIGAVGRRFRKA